MIPAEKHLLWSYLALVTCILACVGDLAALFFFARLYPAYDPALQPISALGASSSPIARLVSWWWIFLGFIFLLFAIAYGEGNYTHHPVQRHTAWLIGIYAVGEEIGSGVFPGNHIAGHLTTLGILHNVAGGIGVIALVAIPFILMRKYSRTEHPSFSRFLLIISVLGIFFFLAFSISRLTIPEIRWLNAWHGIWQRLFVVNYYILLVVISIKLAIGNRINQIPKMHKSEIDIS